jgi:hypothetical protein
MTDLLKELLETSDYVMNRLDQRLEGMTDEEHQWKPEPASWTVLGDGTVEHPDQYGRPMTDPPLTTIAWRLWHIGRENCLGFAQRAWDVAVDEPIDRWQPGADASRAALRDAYQRLRDGIVAKGNDFLEQPMGPAWGPYAESTFGGLWLHVIDENIHHGAEVGMLRDLYRVQVTQARM